MHVYTCTMLRYVDCTVCCLILCVDYTICCPYSVDYTMLYDIACADVI